MHLHALIDSEIEASAHRLDGSVAFKDFFAGKLGKVTFYYQDVEAGYSSPGQVTDRDTAKYGTTADLPFSERMNVRLKADKRIQQEGLETEAGELNLDYRVNDHWTVSPGVRSDSREDNSPVVPLTQEEGERTDVAARLLYDSRARWNGYGFGSR